MLALSVSISTSSSPRETSSPSDFSHFRIVPSSIESDRRGIATSGIVAAYRSGDGRRPLGLLGGGGPEARQRERDDGPAALALVHPDAAAVAFDDLAADREADACALVDVAAVEALEHA